MKESIVIWRRVWDRGPQDRTERFLLLAIADHADDSGHAFPSLERLGERCILSKRSVISTLNQLEKDGWLKRIKNGRKSEYQIVLGSLGMGAQISPVTHRKGANAAPMNGADISPVEEIGEIDCTEKVQSTAAIGAIHCNPPAPPNRRTTKERPYEPAAETIDEVVRAIVAAEPSLAGDATVLALATAIESGLRAGSRLEQLIEMLPAQSRKYASARDRGKFEIRGWGLARFFSEGHWKDEQSWPWKPEYRPEPKLRYRDPATLYDGPEYQRRAEGA